MELPTEKNAYVTIAILDMPFRVQRYGPYGEAHQNVWQQVMERLEQLQVVGWRVCWARVVGEPTNLAIIVYHPKHPSKRGPKHDTLFLNNILQPLIELIRHPPRYINLELDIPSGSAFTAPQNGLTKLFLLDVVTGRNRHDSMTPELFDGFDALSDPLKSLPITSLQPDHPPPGTIINRNKNYDLRTIRRGQYIPPDADTYPHNVRHDALTIEFATKKASKRFQDPTKPCTGVSHPSQLEDDAWNTEFLLPLQSLQDQGVVVGAERLILESFAWPVVKVTNKIEKVPRSRDLAMFDLTGIDEARRDVEKRMRWLERALTPFRSSPKKPKADPYGRRSEEGDDLEQIEEVVQWIKSHSRTDSGYTSGNYSTVTTVEAIPIGEEGSVDGGSEKLKRSTSTLDRLRLGNGLGRPMLNIV